MRYPISALAAALLMGGASLAVAQTATSPMPQDDAAARGESVMDEESVRVMLEAQGYESIGDVQKEGEAFTATAERDGEEHELRIDAQTGEVSEN